MQKEPVNSQYLDKRHEGVELGRLIAILAVVQIHLPSFSSRFIYFAVPYFLALSGYFFAKNLSPEYVAIHSWKNFASRHWRLFFFWGFFYSLLPSDWPMNIIHGGFADGILETFVRSKHKLISNPLNWFLDGPPLGFHLWYLANAPIAAGLIFLCIKFNLRWLLRAIALVSIAILISLNSSQCIGTVQWATNAKLGLLVAIPSLTAGWEYRFLKSSDRRAAIGIILMAGGLIPALFGFKLVAKGCFPVEAMMMGIGLLIILLEWPRLPGGKLWVALGKLTAGVYVLHIAFRPIIHSLAPKIGWFPNTLWFLFLAFLTFVIVYWLSRFELFRRWLS